MVLLLAFVIGMTTGFRSLTPPAILAWVLHQRVTPLSQTWLSFMTASWTPYIFTVLACLELVSDKLPFTPSRLAPGPFGARIVSGALCGATLCGALNSSLLLGAIAGAIGGVAGSFAGYHIRHTLVANAKLPDIVVALGEDVVTIVLAYLVASRI